MSSTYLWLDLDTHEVRVSHTHSALPEGKRWIRALPQPPLEPREATEVFEAVTMLGVYSPLVSENDPEVVRRSYIPGSKTSNDLARFYEDIDRTARRIRDAVPR